MIRGVILFIIDCFFIYIRDNLSEKEGVWYGKRYICEEIDSTS